MLGFGRRFMNRSPLWGWGVGILVGSRRLLICGTLSLVVLMLWVRCRWIVGGPGAAGIPMLVGSWVMLGISMLSSLAFRLGRLFFLILRCGCCWRLRGR